MLYINRPGGHRRYWPMVFLERCAGIAAPYDPWYQKVQLSLALELPPPDLIVAEGGNLTQCSAISRMFGRKRCLAHLHGQTSCSHEMDAIYGGILALSEFIRDDYLKTSELDRKHAYILHNCIDTARFVPGPADAALRGRDKFVDACWDWTHEYGGIIVEQIKRMGCSVDFDNERFTMDEDYAQAVRKVFCDWYHDGLIYRGKRIVNWCPNCTTAISDDEAEYRDERGHLWFMRYPLVEPVNGQDYIVVATTRPETMLGDTGVAVSPKDPEKAAFVGKTVKLPIVDREIPIFEDWHVDANFGSGFVKVTPAHDPNDYAMGQAHDLEQINVFDEHAIVVEGYGEFSGMSRDECREAIVKWFDEHGLLDHIVLGTKAASSIPVYA